MSIEQFKTLLENSTGLTDEFKKSAEPIFQEAVEAAVSARLDEECRKAVAKALSEAAPSESVKEIKESFTKELSKSADKIAALEESIESMEAEHKSELESVMEQVDAMAEAKSAEMQEQMMSRINTYLDYVVEDFVKGAHDKLVERKQSDISEAFLCDLGELFEQYNIEKPEGYGSMKEELEGLKIELARANKDLSEQLQARADLEEEILQRDQQAAVRRIAEEKGLSEAERGRLESLMEGFSGDFDNFSKKADTLASALQEEVSPEAPKSFVTESAVISGKSEQKPLTEAAMLAARMRRLYQ